MTQFVSLSSKVQTLVNHYVNLSRAKSPFDDNILKKLLISVYSRTADADTELLHILEKYLIDLGDYYTDDDINILLSEYSALAMYCHQHDDIFYSPLSDRESPRNTGFKVGVSDFLTPIDLVSLCLKIADCKADSNIYLPFAGTCSFALYQSTSCHYDADEISTEVWAYSKILLMSQSIAANLRCRDCLVRDDASKIKMPFPKYDYIFSFPPMSFGREERYIANTFLFLAQNALKDNGELYCLLPMSFCYGRDWFEFRESLLMKSANVYSAIVISLPPLFKPYASVSMCLLCLKKDGKGTICLVDATDETFSVSKDLAGWKQSILKADSIIETISEQDEKYVWVGKSEDLSGDINLQPSRYLINDILPKANNGEKLFKLADLVDIVPFTGIVTNKIAEERDIPFIGIKELSSSYLNCDIYRKEIPVLNRRIGYRILTSDCLLIGFISGKFKVGRIHGASKTEPVALRPEIFAVKLKSKAITEDFLLRCIMAKETELQANRLSIGGVISRLTKSDFLSISVLVPTLIAQQESLCKEDTRSSLTESDRQLLESAESFRRDIHMKKHAIGQTIFNLNNWMKVLQRARKDGNGIVDDNAVVGTIHKTKVADIYSNLQAVMQELQIKISKLDSGYGMQCREIPLTDFIEDYIQKNPSPVFQYVFDSISNRAQQTITDPDGEIVIAKGDPIGYVHFPVEALTIIFDNIINNACCHGFENTADSKNLVRIEIMTEGENYIVNISNNGKPLLPGYDSESVLTYGISSKEGNGHYGIGGYEVRKLMQEFDGDAKFISNPDDEFSVTYKLIFHKNNIVASFSI